MLNVIDFAGFNGPSYNLGAMYANLNFLVCSPYLMGIYNLLGVSIFISG